MEELIKEHRSTYVYYKDIPLQTWWYSQKKLWFSHCDMNIDNFVFKENYTDSASTIGENYVIWWDQIMRHPIDHPDQQKRESMYPSVYMIANELYDKVDETAQIFMLLAIRHSKNLSHKKFVCDRVREMITDKFDRNKEVSNVWFRFWKASLEDLMKSNTNVLNYINVNSYNTTEHSSTYDTICDKMNQEVFVPTTWFQSFKSSLDDLMKRKSNVLEYIHANPSVHSNTPVHECYTKVYVEFCKQMEKNSILDIPALTISLSGGVDSMVLAYCADAWCSRNNISLILLHIQYNNRKESEQEVAFLKSWIEQNILNCVFYVRSITELTRRRETKWRTLYEDITRQYRFQAYSMTGGHVLLGHNYEDTVENILTNITSQTHYENMKGMSFKTMYNNVTLYRPFLNVSKRDLYQFAEVFTIPHLPDSTPEWSRRGMLRDKVIPALNTFDTKLVEGLTTLSNKLSIYHSMYVKSIMCWITTHVIQKQKYLFTMKTHKTTVSVNTESYYCIPYDDFTHQIEFWDIFFDHFNIRCSTKSKELLIHNIGTENVNRRTTLSSTINVFLDSHIHIFTTS